MPDYTLFGLKVRVPFALLGVEPSTDAASPDVELRQGAVPFDLDHATARGDYWQAAPGVFLLRCGPAVGRFLVEGGDRITYQASAQPDASMVSFQIVHNLMAAVLRNRGVLVLHANTLRLPRGAVAISGHSGAGKSTTAAGLLAKGAGMVADDVAAVSIAEDRQVTVAPGVGEMHLRPEAVAALGLAEESGSRYSMRSKAVVPVEVASGRPVTLADLYLLVTGSESKVRVERLRGAGLFDALQDCIYGPLLAADTPPCFPVQAALARSVRVWRITRPQSRWSLDEVVEAIIDG
jgi:hypothetical protein